MPQLKKISNSIYFSIIDFYLITNMTYTKTMFLSLSVLFFYDSFLVTHSIRKRFSSVLLSSVGLILRTSLLSLNFQKKTK